MSASRRAPLSRMDRCTLLAVYDLTDGGRNGSAHIDDISVRARELFDLDDAALRDEHRRMVSRVKALRAGAS